MPTTTGSRSGMHWALILMPPPVLEDASAVVALACILKSTYRTVNPEDLGFPTEFAVYRIAGEQSRDDTPWH
ncbi:MAG: hypothetical protein O3B84_05610 [Chloroflexi bacterium]|nr:hypothetical protein [Chloroflexota bacterium]